jgi:hypothetical protein
MGTEAEAAYTDMVGAGERLLRAHARRASNVCAAAPVFPFDGYEPDHKGQPTAASPPVDGSFLRMTKARKNIIPAPMASSLYEST